MNDRRKPKPPYYEPVKGDPTVPLHPPGELPSGNPYPPLFPEGQTND